MHWNGDFHELPKELVDALSKRLHFGREQFQKLANFPGWQSSRTLRLVTFSVIIGALGAGAAQVFSHLLDWVQELLLHDLAGYHGAQSVIGMHGPEISLTGLWWIPVVTTVGGLLTGLIVWRHKDVRNSGTDNIIRSFHHLGGSLPNHIPFYKTVASALTIGSGGSAGREGPVAHVTAAMSSMLSRFLRLSPADRRVLVLSGVAAGLSASFHSPLGAAILSVELLYSMIDFEVDALVYAIIASSVAYALNGLVEGWEPLLQVPSGLALNGALDLVWYAGLGIVAGILGPALPSLLYRVEETFDEWPIPIALQPALGGLLVGLIALFLPEILGGGYEWMQQAIDGQLPLLLMVLLLVFKIVATALTVGSGGSGGKFAPSMFIGCMMGASMASGLHAVFPNAASEPQLAAMAVVGMGAYFSAAGRTPIATLIFTAELTGGYGLLVPTMLASVTAFLVANSIEQRLKPKFPHLYREQVPSRLHSPTHQAEYIHGVLQLMSADPLPSSSGQMMSWQQLGPMLRSGKPIPVGPDGQYLFGVLVPEDGPSEGKRIADIPFAKADILIASILRDGHNVTPHGETVLHAGDILLVICHHDAIQTLKDYTELIRIGDDVDLPTEVDATSSPQEAASADSASANNTAADSASDDSASDDEPGFDAPEPTRGIG